MAAMTMMAVLDWLRDLPTPLLLLVSLLVTSCVMLLTGVAARLLRRTPENSAEAVEAYKVIVTFTAIMLSFTLVQAVTLFHAAESSVVQEANALNQLDRLLTRYHTQTTDAARPVLVSYMRTLIDQEWPAMRHGTAMSVNNPYGAPLNRMIITLEGGTPTKPQLYAEMLKQLDAVNDLRQARLENSAASVSTFIWQANLALCAVLLVLSALIRVKGRLIAIGGHAVAIAMLMAVTFAVDQPFRGDVSITPAPIQRTLHAVLARTS